MPSSKTSGRAQSENSGPLQPLVTKYKLSFAITMQTPGSSKSKVRYSLNIHGPKVLI